MALTEQYYKDMDQARKVGGDAYNTWFYNNHYEDKRGVMRPASYYTELRPLPQLMNQYKERVPNSRYSKISPKSDWYNANWDPEGPAIQPNKKLYDNSRAYNEMSGKPEVKALYD
jgi:hypothetical protein